MIQNKLILLLFLQGNPGLSLITRELKNPVVEIIRWIIIGVHPLPGVMTGCVENA
jgi:hypothetical protein